MKFFNLVLISFLAVSCTSAPPTATAAGTSAEHPEASPYIENDTANVDVEAALSLASATDKHAIIVMGANWCHDSRALAGWFETPRFQTMLKASYVVEYVDVGQKDRNIDIAKRFGLDDIVGTPTIIVTDNSGEVLNLETAPTWRNAASRNEDDIFDYFVDLAPKTTE